MNRFTKNKQNCVEAFSRAAASVIDVDGSDEEAALVAAQEELKERASVVQAESGDDDESDESTSENKEERKSVRLERIDNELRSSVRRVRRAQEKLIIAAVASIPEVKTKMD